MSYGRAEHSVLRLPLLRISIPLRRHHQHESAPPVDADSSLPNGQHVFRNRELGVRVPPGVHRNGTGRWSVPFLCPEGENPHESAAIRSRQTPSPSSRSTSGRTGGVQSPPRPPPVSTDPLVENLQTRCVARHESAPPVDADSSLPEGEAGFRVPRALHQFPRIHS